MSQMISQRECRCDVLDEVAGLVGEVGEQPVDDLVGLGLHDVLDRGDLLRGEALRHDRAEPEVLRIVHVDHRAEELVHLLRQVADVRPPWPEQKSFGLRLTCQMSSWRVDGPVPRAGREWEVGDLALVVVDEPRGVTQRLERTLAVRTGGQPEFGIGQVEVVETDLVVWGEHRHGGDCTGTTRSVG